MTPDERARLAAAETALDRVRATIDHLIAHPGAVATDVAWQLRRDIGERPASPAAADAGTWPRGVTDPHCAQGHHVETPADRRLLWHLEGQISTYAPHGSALDRLARDLRQYLNETCQHHWHEYEPEPGNENDVPAHRQCLWCNDVEWCKPNGPAAPPARLPARDRTARRLHDPRWHALQALTGRLYDELENGVALGGLTVTAIDPDGQLLIYGAYADSAEVTRTVVVDPPGLKDLVRDADDRGITINASLPACAEGGQGDH